MSGPGRPEQDPLLAEFAAEQAKTQKDPLLAEFEAEQARSARGAVATPEVFPLDTIAPTTPRVGAPSAPAAPVAPIRLPPVVVRPLAAPPAMPVARPPIAARGTQLDIAKYDQAARAGVNMATAPIRSALTVGRAIGQHVQAQGQFTDIDDARAPIPGALSRQERADLAAKQVAADEEASRSIGVAPVSPREGVIAGAQTAAMLAGPAVGKLVGRAVAQALGARGAGAVVARGVGGTVGAASEGGMIGATYDPEHPGRGAAVGAGLGIAGNEVAGLIRRAGAPAPTAAGAEAGAAAPAQRMLPRRPPTRAEARATPPTPPPAPVEPDFTVEPLKHVDLTPEPPAGPGSAAWKDAADHMERLEQLVRRPRPAPSAAPAADAAPVPPPAHDAPALSAEARDAIVVSPDRWEAFVPGQRAGAARTPAPRPAGSPPAQVDPDRWDATDASGRPLPGQTAPSPHDPVGIPRDRGETPANIRGEPTPPGGVRITRMRTADIVPDPARFQYKSGGDEVSGAGGELKGLTRFDESLAGVLSVWRDPATGIVHPVNGHHRHELATRTGHPSLNVVELDAQDANEARAMGAVQNIAEGRGTPLDAANFFRSSGLTPADLADRVSVKGAVMRQGMGLAKLAPDLFSQVARGELPEAAGAVLGETLDTPALQRTAAQALRGSAKRLTEQEVREVARQVRDAGSESVNQDSLFGPEAVEAPLYVEKAQLAAQVQRRLAQDKRLFGFVAKGGRAEELARGGNVIDATRSAEMARESAQLEEVFTQLYTRAGPIAQALTDAARQVKHGQNPRTLVDALYPAIRDAVSQALPGGQGARHAAPGGAGAGEPIAAEGEPRAVASAARADAPAAPDDDARDPDAPVRDSTDPGQAGMFAGEKGAKYGVTLPQVAVFDHDRIVETKSPAEMEAVDNHHSHAFSPEALRIESKGALAYRTPDGEVTVNVGPHASPALTDEVIARHVAALWPGHAAEVVRQNPDWKKGDRVYTLPPSTVAERGAHYGTDLFGNEEPAAPASAQGSMFGDVAGTTQSRSLKETEAAARAELDRLTARIAANHGRSLPPPQMARKAELEKLVNRDKAISHAELATRRRAEGPGTFLEEPADYAGGHRPAGPYDDAPAPTPARTPKQERARADRLQRKEARTRREERLWANHAKLSSPEFLAHAHEAYARELQQLTDADLLAYARGFDVDGLAAQAPLVEVLKARGLTDQVMGPQRVAGERAYHGGPHRFPKFSLDAIGSGEGAQVYRWGLYFASRKEIAEWYREKLSRASGPSLAELRDYFTPGTVLDHDRSWGNHADRVEAWHEPTGPGEPWSVTVRKVRQTPEGEWVPVQGEYPRTHRTPPSRGELDRVLGASLPQFAALTRAENAILSSGVHEHLTRANWPSAVPARIEGVIAGIRQKIEGDQYELNHRKDYGNEHGDRRSDEGIQANIARMERQIAALEKLQASGDFSTVPNRPKPGALYHVEIPSPDTMLDWDAELAAQPEAVQTALRSADLAPRDRRTGEDIYFDLTQRLQHDIAFEQQVAEALGVSLVEVQRMGEPQAASRYLHALGINGIKYLDGTSRNRGAGSHNYVVFDDAAIEVLHVEQARRRYDAAAAAQGDLFAQAQANPDAPAEVDARRDEAVVAFGSEAIRDEALAVHRPLLAKLEATRAPLVADRAAGIAAHRMTQPARDGIDVRGVQLRSAEDGARLMALYSDPQVERFHVFYLAEHSHDALTSGFGDIAGHTANSVGALSFTVAPRPEDIVAHARRLGVRRVLFGHNHPSGDATASEMDKRLTIAYTRALAQQGVTVAGHVVIDHDEYAFIEGGLSEDRLPFGGRTHAYQTAVAAGAPQFTSATAAAHYLKDVTAPDAVTLLVMDAQRRVLALHPILPEALAQLPEALGPLLLQLGGHDVVVAADPTVSRVFAAKAMAALRGVAGRRGATVWAHDILDIFSVSPTHGVQSLTETREYRGQQHPHRTADVGKWANKVRLDRTQINRTDAPGAGGPASAVARRGRPATALPDDRRAAPGAGAVERTASAPLTAYAAGRAVVRLQDDVRKLLNPGARSEEAGITERTVRPHNAAMALGYEQAREALSAFSGAIERLSEAEQLAFIDAIETGQPAPRGLGDAARALRRLLDDTRDEVIALGTGKLEQYIEDYFPHIWQDPKAAAPIIQQVMGGRRPIHGPKGFLKHRTIPTTADGIAAGLVPVTTNPIDLTLLKIREMRRYIMAERIIAELKERKLLVFVNGHRPDGLSRIEDRFATVYGPKDIDVPTKLGGATTSGSPTVPSPGRQVMGEWMAPEPVARVLNNFLSPGLRGNAVYTAVAGVNNVLNQAQLGLSLFHLGFTSVDAAVSQAAAGLQHVVHGAARGDVRRVAHGAQKIATFGAAPLTTWLRGRSIARAALSPAGAAPELAALVAQVIEGGGRVRQDTFYETGAWKHFRQAVRQRRPLKAGGWAVPAVFDLSSKFIMEVVVPYQKLGVFAQLASRALADLPPEASQDDVRRVLGRAWDSVENRLGQLTYDNLFWNRMVKDVAQIGVRSVGWNLGTLRELGGGALDLARGRGAGADHLELSERASYTLMLPVVLAVMGAVATYLLTGRAPDELQDYFFPPTGRTNVEGNPERIQLPSYMKDVWAYKTHPWETAKHKLSPVFSAVAEMLDNEDFYGDLIRNPDDPVVTQAAQEAAFWRDQLIPFGVRNAQESSKRVVDDRMKVAGFLGVTAAPRAETRTKAQNQMMTYLGLKSMGGDTPEKAEVRKASMALTTRAREGTLTEAALDSAETAGTITPARRGKLERLMDGEGDIWLERFARLDVDQALKVYKLTRPDERAKYREALENKLYRAGRDDEADALAPLPSVPRP